MPLDFTSVYSCKLNLGIERTRYAAFVYDKIKHDYSHSKAVVLACREAGISPPELKWFLPKHNWERKIIRNHKIINARASGYSINLIAKTHKVHRCTVGRVLTAFKDRMNMVEKYSRQSINGRLTYDQMEFNFEGKT